MSTRLKLLYSSCIAHSRTQLMGDKTARGVFLREEPVVFGEKSAAPLPRAPSTFAVLYAPDCLELFAAVRVSLSSCVGAIRSSPGLAVESVEQPGVRCPGTG